MTDMESSRSSPVRAAAGNQVSWRRPTTKIKDNYPRYALTRNDVTQRRDGIIHKNMPDLTRDEEL